MPVKHIIRTKNGKMKKVALTRGKAIRLFCKECVSWDLKEVRRCEDEHCPLHPFRVG